MRFNGYSDKTAAGRNAKWHHHEPRPGSDLGFLFPGVAGLCSCGAILVYVVPKARAPHWRRYTGRTNR